MSTDERGSALFVALVTILVVTLSILIVTNFVFNRKMTFEVEERNVIISTLVDAAMAETLAELADEPYFRGVASRPFGRGTISSKVTISDQGFRRVVAVGTFEQWSATLDAEVSVGTSTPRVVSWNYTQGAAR